MRTLPIATNRHNRWMTREQVRPLPRGGVLARTELEQTVSRFTATGELMV